MDPRETLKISRDCAKEYVSSFTGNNNFNGAIRRKNKSSDRYAVMKASHVHEHK